MSDKLIKERLEMTAETARETAQALLEGDALVPDVKPDMAAVLKAEAEVCVEKCEALPGRVRYGGKLNIHVLYLAKGGERGVYAISTSAPLEDYINIEGLTPDAEVTVSAQLSDVSFRCVNDRKIGYRAVVELTAEATAKIAYDAVTAIEGLPENQMKRRVLKVNGAVCRLTDRFSVRDEFTLPSGKPTVRDILQVSAVIANKEARAGNGRVTVSGDLILTALYKGDDGVLDFIERELPFNGQIDAPNAREGCFADARLEVAERAVQAGPDMDGEDRVLNCEALISAVVRVTSRSDTEVLEDAYSVDQKLTFAKEAVQYPRLVCRNKNQYPVKEICQLEDGQPDMLRVLRVSGRPIIDDVRLVDDKVTVEGVIHADILYIAESDDAPLGNRKAVVPFQQVIEAKGAARHMDARLEATVDHTAFNMLSGREAELRFLLSLNAVVTERAEAGVVTDVTFEAPDKEALEKMAGVVIYSVRPNDSLWDIAKRFGATAEDIAAVNDLGEAAKPTAGQKLVVVKRTG